MNKAEVLAAILRRNQDAIGRAVEGLSHAETLLQLPSKSNCMNWVLGHIATFRDGMLADIRQPEYMTEAETALYDDGSEPITVESQPVDLERLMQLQTQSYDAISRWLDGNPVRLERESRQDISIRKGYLGYWETVIEHFAQNICHESIHVGELSALRELALVSLGERRK